MAKPNPMGLKLKYVREGPDLISELPPQPAKVLLKGNTQLRQAVCVERPDQVAPRRSGGRVHLLRPKHYQDGKAFDLTRGQLIGIIDTRQTHFGTLSPPTANPVGLLNHLFITYLLEIIMDTNAIISAVMQQLVDTVADEVIRKLKAEGSAHFSLESEVLSAAIVHSLEFDAAVRENIRDIVTDTIDNTNLSDNSEFQDLQR